MTDDYVGGQKSKEDDRRFVQMMSEDKKQWKVASGGRGQMICSDDRRMIK